MSSRGVKNAHEQGPWQQLTHSQPPAFAQMTYDRERNHAYLVSSPGARLWRWNDTHWQHLEVLSKNNTAPFSFIAYYDTQQKQAVVGYREHNKPTWTFVDANNTKRRWQIAVDTQDPSLLGYAYDESRQALVMITGAQSNGSKAWALSQTKAQQLPSKEYLADLAYDEANKRLVANTIVGGLYALAPTGWTEISMEGGTSGSKIAYDHVRRKVIKFIATEDGTMTLHELAGEEWREVSPRVSSTHTSRGTIMRTQSGFLLHGGQDFRASAAENTSSTWRCQNNVCTEMNSPFRPAYNRSRALHTVGDQVIRCNYQDLSCQLLSKKGWQPWLAALPRGMREGSFDDRVTLSHADGTSVVFLNAKGELWRGGRDQPMRRWSKSQGGPGQQSQHSAKIAYIEASAQVVLVLMTDNQNATWTFDEKNGWRKYRSKAFIRDVTTVEKHAYALTNMGIAKWTRGKWELEQKVPGLADSFASKLLHDGREWHALAGHSLVRLDAAGEHKVAPLPPTEPNQRHMAFEMAGKRWVFLSDDLFVMPQK